MKVSETWEKQTFFEGIRNHRKEAMDMVKVLKEDGLSEDMVKDAEDQVQSIINSFTSRIDKILDQKESSIMTI